MASTVNRLCLSAARGSRLIQPRAAYQPRRQLLRPFHASPSPHADSSGDSPKPPRSAISQTGVDSEVSEESVKELEEVHHQVDKQMPTALHSDLKPMHHTEPELGAFDQEEPGSSTTPGSTSAPEERSSTIIRAGLDKYKRRIAGTEAAEREQAKGGEEDSIPIDFAQAQEYASSTTQTPFVFETDEALPAEEWQKIINNPDPSVAQAVYKYRSARSAAFLSFEREVREAEGPPPRPPRRRRPEQMGLMALGEDNEAEGEDDEDFEGDDMSSLGHGHLEEHREIREYARIAAWEMPLLSKYAKPFTPPPPSAPLRFRSTTYMGESHPAEPKISLEFCTADLPLTPAQRLKLIKLLGPRYNPQKDLVRMSCETFPNAAQNKRYLGDLVDTLITEAKNEGDKANGGKDKFDDVPVDFRHVKWKTEPQFPEGWKLDKKGTRSERLRERWRDEREIDEGRVRVLIDGRKAVEEAARAEAEASRGGRMAQGQKVPVLAATGARSTRGRARV